LRRRARPVDTVGDLSGELEDKKGMRGYKRGGALIADSDCPSCCMMEWEGWGWGIADSHGRRRIRLIAANAAGRTLL
jgi:hypothetical protein